MAYDKNLAARIRSALGQLEGLEEKTMFGGVGFLINGNMACGVHKDDLIIRVGPEKHKEALAQAHTRPFDMTGRPMAGWIVVEAEACASRQELDGWVQQGVAFARSLLKKEK